MAGCLSRTDLERLHAGEMNPAAEAGIRAHLAACEDCRHLDAILTAERAAAMGGLRADYRTAPADQAVTQPAAPRTEPSEFPPMDAFVGYEIVRELSRGGQGVVFQAIQQSTKRKVAIKVLLEGAYASAAARRRFEREIELVAALKHPAIISIFHSGQTSDGRMFYVMDYVRGSALNRYVREKKLGLEGALKLFGQVCEAVQYAHQRGVIHRDLKPSNILVDPDGHPKILDFGLAKFVSAPIQTIVSVTEQVVGTLPYMSPEQARGNPDEIDMRTDIYSLGVVLYELLTGHFPYPVLGQMADVLRHIVETEPTPPSRRWTADAGVPAGSASSTHRRLRAAACPIDDEIQTIVLKALAKERERRYRSAADLAADIQHYLSGEAIEAKRDSAMYLLRKSLRRHRGVVAAAAAVVLALALGLAGTTWQARLANEQAAAARRAEAEQRRLARSESTARKLAEDRRAVADRKTAEAEKSRKDAQFETYIANLTAADAAYAVNEPARVRARLDACPVELRNWEWGWLDARSDLSLAVLRGHKDVISSCAFNAEGTRVVTASADKTARVWDATSGEQLALLRHEYDVLLAQFSPNGQRVGTAARDGTARVWDAVQGKELVVFRGHTTYLHSIEFNHDGARVLTTSMDGTARLWDPASGEELGVMSASRDRSIWAHFSPDGARVITASGGSSRTWDAATGRELNLEPASRPFISGGNTFSSDGKRSVVVGSNNTAEIWNVDGDKILLRGHESNVRTAAISPDGMRAVTASLDNTARVWDATGTQQGMVRPAWPWDEIGLRSGAFSPDGSLVIAASGATARIWELATGRQIWVLRGHMAIVTSVAFSPDGRRAITSSLDKTARIWDTALGEELAVLRGHENRVSSAAFSPDGRRLLTASWDRTARLWDATTMEERAVLRGHDDIISSAAFSPDSTRVVTASYDKTARIWNAASGTELVRFRGHEGWVYSTAFSSDGTQVVSASGDKTARTWTAATGQEVSVLRGHEGVVSSAAFSPDGARVVTGSWDKTARVWDSATGKELAILRGHDGIVESVAFSIDGSRIVTTSHDNGLYLWDSRPYRVRYADLMAARQAVVPMEQLVSGRLDAGEDPKTIRRSLAENRSLTPGRRHAGLAAVCAEEERRWSDRKEAAQRADAEAARLKAEALNLKLKPARLNEAAWALVKGPGATADETTAALSDALKAAELEPDNAAIVNTLGVAQYRAGLLESAIATLARSTAMYAKRGERQPADVAFTAMAQFKLGFVHEARESLHELRDLIADTRRAASQENRSFLDEAEAVIEGKTTTAAATQPTASQPDFKAPRPPAVVEPRS